MVRHEFVSRSAKGLYVCTLESIPSWFAPKKTSKTNLRRSKIGKHAIVVATNPTIDNNNLTNEDDAILNAL